MAKALSTVWDKQGGPEGRAWRSALNIPQYLLVTAAMAGVGTYIMTGKAPKPPAEDEEFEDWLRDQFKIRTPWKDWKGREVAIDLMTSDKDYFEQLIKPGIQAATGRPLQAIGTFVESFTRTAGGMKSTPFGIAIDVGKVAMGEVLVDWKGERVYHTMDPAIIKLNKLVQHLWDRIEPIPVSTTRRMMAKNMDPLVALVAGTMGVRPSLPEKEKKRQRMWGQVYSYRDRRSELMKVIRQGKMTRADVESYNQMVRRAAEHPLVDKDLAKQLDGLRIKDLDWYELKYGYDALMEEAVTMWREGRYEDARDALRTFNRDHPGAKVAPRDIKSRILGQQRRRELTVEQKDAQALPRALRPALNRQ